ncbi:MAG: formate/nitrite transporter family protein [Ancalomicrobiaceae bacterium]|nr:formate/nitrite transporter family protein [Ancalomicrobiaceae bacterium]
MADEKSAHAPALFGSDAYSPAEIEDKVEKLGVKKARMPFLPELVLSIVAGGSIGIGGMFFCIVLGDPTLGYAVQRVMGGVVFALGLALVMIGGAELFTGNCLIVMAWANKQISSLEVLKNWSIVWVGNLIGALGLVFLLWMCHFPDLNGGNVGIGMLKLAIGKLSPDFVTIFFKGIMCNILVCLGVWLAYAGRSVSDKMAGMVLPVAAFVAAGFEHCIANMFFLPMAWLMVETGHVPTGLDVSVITLPSIIHNLIPATLGNIVGGAGFVGAVYWLIYRKGLGGITPLPKQGARSPAAAE